MAVKSLGLLLLLPGDAGVAIGSVIQTQGMVVPAAVGSDINCGMRLHVVDLSRDDFLAQRDKFVNLMKGDYFLGTRDVTMTAATSRAMFDNGIPCWLEQMGKAPLGSVANSDFTQLWQEIDRVQFLGALHGNARWAPSELVPASGLVRDGSLGTIGGGNHFVEIQQILAELLRLRLRQVYGDIAAPLVCDIPHNLTFPDNPKAPESWIVRKGACAAAAGQLLITPGSMGTPSYLLSGLGNKRYLSSAAHGAGRAISRFDLTRAGANYTESDLGLTGVDCITLREERRIEEAPAAYKSIDRVVETQVAAGMVEVVAKMQPILTFKA